MSERDTHADAAFGYLFLLAQRWQTLGDQFLAQWDLTTKQWLLLATLELQLDRSASLGEAATAYGSSHQNIKQMARSLEKAGFLRLFKDPRDQRVLRMEVTQKNYRFWETHKQETQNYINRLFTPLPDDDVRNLAGILRTLNDRAGELNNREHGTS